MKCLVSDSNLFAFSAMALILDGKFFTISDLILSEEQKSGIWAFIGVPEIINKKCKTEKKKEKGK